MALHCCDLGDPFINDLCPALCSKMQATGVAKHHNCSGANALAQRARWRRRPVFSRGSSNAHPLSSSALEGSTKRQLLLKQLQQALDHLSGPSAILPGNAEVGLAPSVVDWATLLPLHYCNTCMAFCTSIHPLMPLFPGQAASAPHHRPTGG